MCLRNTNIIKLEKGNWKDYTVHITGHTLCFINEKYSAKYQTFIIPIPMPSLY